MEPEIGDIVLCTVDRIVGTNVFVKIDSLGGKEGFIVFSEIAPGRIRNIRDYVVPQKKIICKILRASGDRIELSLRRVTQKEQKELKERYSQEKGYENVLKSVLGKESEKIIKKITESYSLYDFLQEAKENPKKLEEFVGKDNAKKIISILNAAKPKKFILKKEIFLRTIEPDGIFLIKEFLKNIKNVEIKYLSGGRYSLKKESEDIKRADQELQKELEELEKKAKNKGIEFSIIKK
ncbi:MAG: hypothetical protein QXU39_02510 [Candidatus Pacearchaeota archaeon]